MPRGNDTWRSTTVAWCRVQGAVQGTRCILRGWHTHGWRGLAQLRCPSSRRPLKEDGANARLHQ